MSHGPIFRIAILAGVFVLCGAVQGDDKEARREALRSQIEERVGKIRQHQIGHISPPADKTGKVFSATSPRSATMAALAPASVEANFDFLEGC